MKNASTLLWFGMLSKNKAGTQDLVVCFSFSMTFARILKVKAVIAESCGFLAFATDR